jgi:hypothetical protein
MYLCHLSLPDSSMYHIEQDAVDIPCIVIRLRIMDNMKPRSTRSFSNAELSKDKLPGVPAVLHIHLQ